MIFRSSGFVFSIYLSFLIVNGSLSDGPQLPSIMVKLQAAKNKMLNSYDKYIRPMHAYLNTTEVWIGLIPRQIISVDEERALFTLDSYLYVYWQDPRLEWKSSMGDYRGKNYMHLPPNLLWIPDITVHNSHSLTVNPAQEILTFVGSFGDVYWVPPIFTQTSCPGLMESTYPYDEVECFIVLGSWAHDGMEISLKNNSRIYLDQFLNIHPRWELNLDKVKIIHNVESYGDEQYINQHFIFTIKRRPLPEIEVTRNPCILIMVITLSVFFLPPNSTKKIHLLGIMLLVLTVLLIYIAWSTKYGIGVLFAVTFLQSTMYIVVATFLLQVLVIFNLCNLMGPVRPPPAAIELLSGPFGKYVCLQWPMDSNNLPLDRMQLKEDDSPSSKDSPTPNDDWLLFAAGLDRLFFVLMSIAMIAIHHL